MSTEHRQKNNNLSLLQKSLFVIPKGLYLPAGRQARWNLPSNFVIGGGYDNNSDSPDIFARDSFLI